MSDSRIFNVDSKSTVCELEQPHNSRQGWTENENSLHKKIIKREKCKLNISRRDLSEVERPKSKFHVKNMINMFLRKSSLYALNRIANSETSTQKAFWAILLIIGIVGSASQVVQYLTSYYNYPVVVNLESICANEQVFPSVTVCNLNSLRKMFEPCLKKELNNDECFSHSTNSDAENISKNIPEPMCELDYDIPSTENAINVTEDNDSVFLLTSLNYKSRVKYGHQFKNFILSCYFVGTKCGPEDFELSVNYFFGNCYTFNSGTEKVISRSVGPQTGLMLELDLEAEEYATFTRSVGARVQIHDPYIENDVDEKGIIVSPGLETHIAITKTIYSRLPAPYKDRCKMYELGNSQVKCKELCRVNNSLSHCFCSMSKMLRQDVPLCDITNPSVICCLMKYHTSKDECECPLSCEETKYNMQMSSSNWPSEAYYKEHKFEFSGLNGTEDVLPFNKVQKTRLRLEMYYDELDYTIYKQSPTFQSSEVLSQIGGQIGLWLGLSLIAIFECLENIMILCKGRRIR